jgi:hypothetical protein
MKRNKKNKQTMIGLLRLAWKRKEIRHLNLLRLVQRKKKKKKHNMKVPVATKIKKREEKGEKKKKKKKRKENLKSSTCLRSTMRGRSG